MRRLPALLLIPLLLFSSFARAEDEFALSWSYRQREEGVCVPRAAALADDNGLFVAGSVTDTLGDTDGFILRLDADGGVRFHHVLGGSGEDVFTHVLAVHDGGCLIMGTTASQDGDTGSARGGKDAWLVRLDADGNIIFRKNLGGSDDDELLDIIAVDEGGFIVCGRTRSRNGDLGANFGGFDAWAAYLAGEDGKPQWVIRYGLGGEDSFHAILPAMDGWLLLGAIGEERALTDGSTTWTARPTAVFVALTGEELWQIALGNGGTQNALTRWVDTETGWLLGGMTDSTSALMPMARGGLDIWALHLRQTGSAAWQRRFGGSKDEKIHSIIALEDGFALLASSASRDGQVGGSHGGDDLWLLRLSEAGALVWQQALGGGADSIPTGMLALADGGFLVAGTTTSQDGDIGRHASVRTGFVCRLSANGNLRWTKLLGGNEECTLTHLLAVEGGAYVIGYMKNLDRTELWIGRME